jgi:hypothetical protein
VIIRFPAKSEFLEALRTGIKLGWSRLERGHPIEIQLKPGGYQGKWVVTIRADDHEQFETVGSMRDPTRFPQRINVAAWALHQEGAFGQFVIEHDRESGTVTIRRQG